MADFRKLFLALIAGALLLGTVASAAQFSCTVSAVPTIIRTEGVAEFVGDVLLTCSGDIPGANGSALIANIRLQLPGARVTSKLVSGTTNDIGTSAAISEATLLLDDTHPWVACSSNPSAPNFDPSCSTNPGLYALDSSILMPKGYQSVGPPFVAQPDGSQNVYQAIQITDNELEWQGVVLMPAGSALPYRTIRLTNVRGYLIGAMSGQIIQAKVNIIADSSIPLAPTNVVTVAEYREGLIATFTPSTNNICFSNTAQTYALNNINVNLREGFATAFRPRYNDWTGPVPPGALSHMMPGGGYLDESGYNPIWSGQATAPPTAAANPVGGGVLVNAHLIGVASTASEVTGTNAIKGGTRFRVVISGIPSGVSLSASGSLVTSNGLNVAYTGTQSGDTFTLYAAVIGYAGNGTAQYTQDTISIPITVVATITNPLPVTGNSPVPGYAQFWPLDTTGARASADGPGGTGDDVPRFNDIKDSADNVLTITQACRTVLLFPYLVQAGGWDSGIAITNTSLDPFNTPNQFGACTLNFYGLVGNNVVNANLPNNVGKQVTPTIYAGQTFVMTLYGGGGVLDPAEPDTLRDCAAGNCVLPGFRGYMIADCSFQYAHGFAFISDLGAQKLSQGYLALVVPDPARNPVPFAGLRLSQNAGLNPQTNAGEQLGN